MALIHLSELPPHRHEEACGLVRLGSPRSEPEWRRCLRTVGTDARGILAASAASGVLLGLAGYEVEDAGQPLGKVLRVPLFVAFELGGRGATAAALRSGLEEIGQKLSCGAVLFAAKE